MFFEQRGGLPIFGYPISGALSEEDAISKAMTTVQYFERARFELAPDGQVRLGLLGRELGGLDVLCPGGARPAQDESPIPGPVAARAGADPTAPPAMVRPVAPPAPMPTPAGAPIPGPAEARPIAAPAPPPTDSRSSIGPTAAPAPGLAIFGATAQIGGDLGSWLLPLVVGALLLVILVLVGFAIADWRAFQQRGSRRSYRRRRTAHDRFAGEPDLLPPPQEPEHRPSPPPPADGPAVRRTYGIAPEELALGDAWEAPAPAASRTRAAPRPTDEDDLLRQLLGEG